VLEGFFLYHRDVEAARLLEASDAMSGLSNASVLATIRDDLVQGRNDKAISTLDRSIRSSLTRYRKAKDELKFNLPGEAEALNIVQQHFPETEANRHDR